MKTEQREHDFYTTHHRIAEQLDTINWHVIGHLTFTKAISHQKENCQRAKIFFCLMNALAVFAKVKTKKLIYFQNNEVEPAKDFHHIHFLIGRQSLEQFDPATICSFLSEKAKELKTPDIVIEPFDAERNGVGYVSKEVFKHNAAGRFEVMDLDFHPSRGLVSLWRQKGLI